MPNLKPDQNNRQIGGGLQHASDIVLPFRVNPITNALLIEIIPKAIGAGVVTQDIPIDENGRHAGAAVTDDANQDIIPLTCEDVVGFPLLRVEVI